jgi:hypothetical protein
VWQVLRGAGYEVGFLTVAADCKADGEGAFLQPVLFVGPDFPYARYAAVVTVSLLLTAEARAAFRAAGAQAVHYIAGNSFQFHAEDLNFAPDAKVPQIDTLLASRDADAVWVIPCFDTHATTWTRRRGGAPRQCHTCGGPRSWRRSTRPGAAAAAALRPRVPRCVAWLAALLDVLIMEPKISVSARGCRWCRASASTRTTLACCTRCTWSASSAAPRCATARLMADWRWRETAAWRCSSGCACRTCCRRPTGRTAAAAWYSWAPSATIR